MKIYCFVFVSLHLRDIICWTKLKKCKNLGWSIDNVFHAAQLQLNLEYEYWHIKIQVL